MVGNLALFAVLKWDARGVVMPQLVPCREISVVSEREAESGSFMLREERCIHGFLMLAMMGCLFLSCSATDSLRSTPDTAEEQLGNQRSSRAEWLQ